VAHNSQAVVRQRTYTVTVPHNAWSARFALDYFAKGGRFARSVLRAPAGSTVTAVTLLIYRGTQTNPALVLDENKVFERAGIVVAGHATDADDDYNILLNHDGAPYDIEDLLASTAAAGADSRLWGAILGTAGAAPMAGVQWSLTAVDVV
jgi:hypothetical protein